ncbi:EXS family-domain-containing protein, partial [Chaetomium strumarium]
PVEFRDVFLREAWCSLTYTTSNIELLFCLYTSSWHDADYCNSSHSRLLEFFALPPTLRAIQCIRSCYDTRNIFPHLFNFGKYTMTLLSAVSLSLYRIEDLQTKLSFFVTFAAMNAVCCCNYPTLDVFVDFSLVRGRPSQKLLRDITALRPIWIYYVTMLADPILRFSWVFYGIFTHNTQYGILVSFIVSLCEVVRRGLWALLRVENEHCTSIIQVQILARCSGPSPRSGSWPRPRTFAQVL